MKPLGQAIRSAALAGALSACLLLPAFGNAFGDSASAAVKPITGELDRAGLTVVALAPHGRVTEARARSRFRLVPPAGAVTLQLRDRSGAYLGPVVVEGRRGRVTLGVRAGAKLGLIKVHHGYGRVVRRLPRGAVDDGVTARARAGVPVGVGSLGWVAGRARGPRAPGLDPDRDGIPDKFDVDDDGNLVIDARRSGGATRVLDPHQIPAAVSLGACPAVVCSGWLDLFAWQLLIAISTEYKNAATWGRRCPTQLPNADPSTAEVAVLMIPPARDKAKHGAIVTLAPVGRAHLWA